MEYPEDDFKNEEQEDAQFALHAQDEFTGVIFYRPSLTRLSPVSLFVLTRVNVAVPPSRYVQRVLEGGIPQEPVAHIALLKSIAHLISEVHFVRVPNSLLERVYPDALYHYGGAWQGEPSLVSFAKSYADSIPEDERVVDTNLFVELMSACLRFRAM